MRWCGSRKLAQESGDSETLSSCLPAPEGLPYTEEGLTELGQGAEGGQMPRSHMEANFGVLERHGLESVISAQGPPGPPNLP